MACMVRTCLAWGAKKQCRETLRSTSQLETCRSQHFQQRKRSSYRGIKFENPCWFTMAFGSTSTHPIRFDVLAAVWLHWTFDLQHILNRLTFSNVDFGKKRQLKGNFLHWQVDGLGMVRLGRLFPTHTHNAPLGRILIRRFQPPVATRDRIEPNITVESSASSIGEIKSPQPPRGWPFYLSIGNYVSTCG